MSAVSLTSAERRALRAHGQTLVTAVQVGHGGATEAVMNELITALRRDQLVKVKTAETDRKVRQVLWDELAGATASALVGTVGRTALFYRATDGQ